MFYPKKSIENLYSFGTRAQLCKIFCKRTSQHKGIQEKCWAFKHIVNRCHGWKFVRKSMKAAASSCRPNTETNVQLCKWQIPRRKRECWTTTTTHFDFKTIVIFYTFLCSKSCFLLNASKMIKMYHISSCPSSTNNHKHQCISNVTFGHIIFCRYIYRYMSKILHLILRQQQHSSLKDGENVQDLWILSPLSCWINKKK